MKVIKGVLLRNLENVPRDYSKPMIFLPGNLREKARKMSFEANYFSLWTVVLHNFRKENYFKEAILKKNRKACVPTLKTYHKVNTTATVRNRNQEGARKERNNQPRKRRGIRL